MKKNPAMLAPRKITEQTTGQKHRGPTQTINGVTRVHGLYSCGRNDIGMHLGLLSKYLGHLGELLNDIRRILLPNTLFSRKVLLFVGSILLSETRNQIHGPNENGAHSKSLCACSK